MPGFNVNHAKGDYFQMCRAVISMYAIFSMQFFLYSGNSKFIKNAIKLAKKSKVWNNKYLTKQGFELIITYGVGVFSIIPKKWQHQNTNPHFFDFCA